MIDAVWVVVEIVGIALVIAGLGVAIGTIHRLRNRLFRGIKLPPHQLGQWLRTRFRTPKTVTGDLNIALQPTTIQVTGAVLRPSLRPALGAPQIRWIQYWDSRFELLEARLTDEATMHSEQLDALRQQVAEHRSSVARELASERSRTNVAVGGDDEGNGLISAWWGVALALVGTFLWGLGGLLA